MAVRADSVAQAAPELRAVPVAHAEMAGNQP